MSSPLEKMAFKTYKFGLFDLNTATRKLQKQGRHVRLQEQPLRILETLLEDPGRLVTRAELKQRLWPGDVNVDFDQGLRAALKRLRFAIGDSGDNPRFIETLPKGGYRFIAPVEVAELSKPRVGIAGSAWYVAAAVFVLIAGALIYWLRPLAPMPQVVRITKLSNSGHAAQQETPLTDGARLYYTEFTDDAKLRFRQILLNGNEDTPVGGMPGDVLIRGLSADHTTFLGISHDEVVKGRYSPLWVVPVTGGPARRLGNALTDDFAWSPDGKSLAFARDGHVWIGDSAGENARLVVDLPGHVYLPRWYVDGRRLRFTVQDANGQLSIWEVAADGGKLHQVQFGLPADAPQGFGEWTADGRYFVFTSRRDGVSNLWIAEEEHDRFHRPHTSALQLTAGPLNYYRPLPSPDGSRIFAVGTEAAGELVRYDAQRRQFVPFLGGMSADHLTFSPDRRWIAYVRYPEGTLWRAASDGSQPLQLTFPPLRVVLPRWSPDGNRILFTANRPGQITRIYTITPEGGNPEPIDSQPHFMADAHWTPSGDAILYGADPDHAPNAPLYRFDMRSKQAEKIPGTEGLFAPNPSPDGRNLLVFSNSGESWLTLALFDLQTGQRTTLSRRKAIYPVWSFDSRYIYFNTLMTPEPAVYRIRIADGKEEKITDIRFAAAGVYGFWSGLAPDGSVLLLRDHSQTDVYALTLARH